MQTTDAPKVDSPEAKADREAAERAKLNSEAERCMSESKPTPSQAEVDAIKLGQMDHDDKEDPENPEMPTLHEQRARIEKAGRSVPYQTRDAVARREADDDQRRAVPRQDVPAKPVDKA